MSKHTFTIAAEFDTSEEYEQFVIGVANLGGEIEAEENDFR